MIIALSNYKIPINDNSLSIVYSRIPQEIRKKEMNCNYANYINK